MKREEQIEKAAERYIKGIVTPLPASIKAAFIAGAIYADENTNLYSVTRKAVERALENLWHDAQGDFLPEIDREVIVLCNSGYGGYKVCFGHRPNPKGWMGISVIDGEKDYYVPETYDKGGWNIPDVKWWLDVSIPNLEE